MASTPKHALIHPNKQRKGDGKGKHRGRPATSLVGAMARLLMQQEDALNELHLELEFMIFAQMGHGSVIPSMVKVSEECTNGQSKPQHHR